MYSTRCFACGAMTLPEAADSLMKVVPREYADMIPGCQPKFLVCAACAPLVKESERLDDESFAEYARKIATLRKHEMRHNSEPSTIER